MLEAWGEHDYRGNKGQIAVTASLRNGGALLLERTGHEEQSHLYLNPFAHHIIGGTRINFEQECGLSADAQSVHSAWWEFAPGSGPTSISKTQTSSQSGLVSQPACTPVASGGGGGGGTSSEGVMCYLWLEYDLLSGEILDWQVIYCSEGG